MGPSGCCWFLSVSKDDATPLWIVFQEKQGQQQSADWGEVGGGGGGGVRGITAVNFVH